MLPAIADSFRKLHPRIMARNPVMFVVEVGSVLTTWRFVQDALAGRPGLGFEFQITFWLWLGSHAKSPNRSPFGGTGYIPF